jgi:hypothetical protein
MRRFASARPESEDVLKSKACKQCKTEKPLTDFYVSAAVSGARSNKCKECTKANVRANYAANVEHYKEYEKGRAMLPHRVELREQYAATPAGRMRGNAAKVAYLDRNPVKRAAHQAVSNAVRDGRLIRQPCEVCGAEKTQAHHDDYSKPLDVRWLCTKHHAEWHRHNTPICPDQSAAA